MKKLLILPLLFLLAGCWDTNQPERMYYIQGLGVDYKDEQYEIYAQIIDFTNIARTEQPNPEATQSEVGVAKGKTIDEAFFKLYQTMDERLFFGHLSYVIFSENVAKTNKSKEIVNTFIRYRELRYTTWVYVTTSSLEELLLTPPIINKSITLSKLSDPLNSFGQSSLIRPITFRELMIQMDEPSHEVAIPFIELSDNWSTDKGVDPGVKFSGYALLAEKEGLKGYLLEDDVEGVQWLSRETDRTEVTIPLEEFSDPHITVVVNDVKPTIHAIPTSNSIQFDINIELIVQANEVTSNELAEKIKDGVEKQVKDEINKTYTAALEKQVDIYRLSEVAYRKKVRAWKEVEKDGKVPLTESSIRSLNVVVTKVMGERTISKEEETSR